jgi:hypothetical protein
LEICNHEYKKLFDGENGVLVPRKQYFPKRILGRT